MATIKDVAERAGVSIATVSHVINKTRYVSEELQARVRQAMEELGYQPNAIARSLRRKETHTIGLIIPDNSNPFFAEVARGIEDFGFQNGYSVILCNSDGDLKKELAYIGVLTSKRVDGIVFIAATAKAEHIKPFLGEIPLVIVDRKMPDLEADSVLVDNFGGGYAATRHLIDLGHRKIGCITGPPDLAPSADRVAGYKQALKDHGLQPLDELIVEGDFRYQSGNEGMRRLLDLEPPPTAVFACNDVMAIGAMKAAQDQGLRVPEDIAIVGFDDITLASFTNPTLTSVKQPKYEMGKIALELLFQRISSSDLQGRQEIILDTTLVVRESTRGGDQAS